MREKSILMASNDTTGFVVYNGSVQLVVEQYWSELYQLLSKGQVRLAVLRHRFYLTLGQYKVVFDFWGYSTLLQRYSKETQSLIRSALLCFPQDVQVASVLLSWLEFPVEAVTEGLKAFLSLPDPVSKGLGYCYGIIRNKAQTLSTLVAQRKEVPVVLDLHAEFERRGGYSLQPQEAAQLLAEIRSSYVS